MNTNNYDSSRFLLLFRHCLIVFLLAVLLTGCATTRDDYGARIFPEKRIDPTYPVSAEEAKKLDTLMSSYPDLLELLQNLISIDSVNPGQGIFTGRSEIFHFCHEYLSSRGIATFLLPVPGTDDSLYNLIAVLEGSSPGKTMVFCGHLDTVPYDEGEWDHALHPLGGAYIDGKVYGRGAIDMKGGVAVMMHVMTSLAQMGSPFSGSLILLLTPDEETGGTYGTAAAVEQFPRLLEAGMTLIAEPTQNPPLLSPAIITGEKGPFWLRLTFFGEGGHSSNPIPGTSALDKAVRFISSFDRFRFQKGEGISKMYFGRQILRRFSLWDAVGLAGNTEGDASVLTDSTVCFTGIISGGTIVNMIPSHAEVIVDFRLLPGITLDDLLKSLESYSSSLGYSLRKSEAGYPKGDVLVEVLLAIEGSQESRDSEELGILSGAFEAVYQTAPITLMSPGFTDAGYLRGSGMKNIFLVGPEGDNPHDVHEYAVFDSLKQLSEFYLLTLLRYLD